MPETSLRCDRCKVTETVLRYPSNIGSCYSLCRTCRGLYYRRCILCNNLYPIEVYSTDADVCPDCIDSGIYRCAICGEVGYYEDSFDSVEGDICGDCSADEGRESSGIHDYGYKPCPIFHEIADERAYAKETGRQLLYMGVELEVGVMTKDVNSKAVNPDIIHTLVDGLDTSFLYGKWDSSITEGNTVYLGVEIVSHPATLAYHREHFSDWKYQVLDLRHEGLRSSATQTCGMHIHVNKSALNTRQLFRILKLVYNNSEFFYSIANRPIAQRYYCELDHSIQAEENELYKDQAIRSKIRLWARQSREAVNISGYHTVEFRLFRGTLSPLAFMKNLECVQAVCDFTKRKTRRKADQLTEGSFKKYITRFNKRYPALVEWMQKRSQL